MTTQDITQIDLLDIARHSKWTVEHILTAC